MKSSAFWLRRSRKGVEGLAVALVTGAGQRLGAAIALALGGAGWTVAAHYRNSKVHAASVVSEICDNGGTAQAFQADFDDGDQVSALVPAVEAALGPVECLINSASLFEGDELATVSRQSMVDHHASNVIAPVMLTQAMAERLPEGVTGCVVNLLDNKLFQPNPDFFAYSLTKYGLKGFTEMAALALAPKIRVNGVAPGLVLKSGDQSDEEFAETHKLNPLQRGVTAEDVINAVLYLVGAEGVTGDIMVVDGGQNLARAPRDIAFLFGAQSDEQ